jgi:NADH:ubiquinone oxidoreductase subunit C
VDAATLISQIEKALPGMILDKQRIGRSGRTSLWIEIRKVVEVAKRLKSDPELLLDWLENISVMEIEHALVVTWFVRSSSSVCEIALRGSVVPAGVGSEVSMPSVREVWGMAIPMERHAGAMFGIRFVPDDKPAAINPWKGFPLRRGFVVSAGSSA